MGSKTTLRELIEIKHGAAFSGKNIVPEEQSRILVTPGHFNVGGGFRHSHKKFYNSDNYKDGYELNPGDLIITMTDLSKGGDTLGYGAIVPAIDGKILLHNQRIGKVIFKNKKIDPAFCHYLLRSASYRDHILATCTGSTVRHTSPSKILDFQFCLPDMSYQIKASNVLDNLENKIDANRVISKTLEEFAQAIFKSWFVNFDPVRAKMENRPTGLSNGIESLFPANFTASKVGKIPNGWSVRPLGDFVQPRKGKPITKKTATDGLIPVVAGGMGPAYFHNQANVRAPVVTVSASGANAGFARLYHTDIWASDCSYISKEQSATPYFWYVFLKLNKEKIYHMQKGDAQPHIYPSDIMRLPVCYPESDKLWQTFEGIVTPFFERIALSEKENTILAELRDLLLPNLISGKISVSEAEKIVGEQT